MAHKLVGPSSFPYPLNRNAIWQMVKSVNWLTVLTICRGMSAANEVNRRIYNSLILELDNSHAPTEIIGTAAVCSQGVVMVHGEAKFVIFEHRQCKHPGKTVYTRIQRLFTENILSDS
jgi:hypothetical protein